MDENQKPDLCEGQLGWSTREQAETALQRLQDINPSANPPKTMLRAAKCNYCRGFHVVETPRIARGKSPFRVPGLDQQL